MNLLLLLTALLASLTGIGAGERGVRQVQDVAVVQTAEAVQAVAQHAHVLPAAARAIAAAVSVGQRWAITPAPLRDAAAHRFERRRE